MSESSTSSSSDGRFSDSSSSTAPAATITTDPSASSVNDLLSRVASLPAAFGPQLPDNHPLKWLQRLNSQTKKDCRNDCVSWKPTNRIGEGGQKLREVPEGYEVIVNAFNGTSRLVPVGWAEETMKRSEKARDAHAFCHGAIQSILTGPRKSHPDYLLRLFAAMANVSQADRDAGRFDENDPTIKMFLELVRATPRAPEPGSEDEKEKLRWILRDLEVYESAQAARRWEEEIAAKKKAQAAAAAAAAAAGGPGGAGSEDPPATTTTQELPAQTQASPSDSAGPPTETGGPVLAKASPPSSTDPPEAAAPA